MYFGGKSEYLIASPETNSEFAKEFIENLVISGISFVVKWMREVLSKAFDLTMIRNKV